MILIWRYLFMLALLYSQPFVSGIFLLFYQGLTAQLKATLRRLVVFGQGLSSFNPHSRFPGHFAESTGRGWIDLTKLSPWCNPIRIGLVVTGFEPANFYFRSLDKQYNKSYKLIEGEGFKGEPDGKIRHYPKLVIDRRF